VGGACSANGGCCEKAKKTGSVFYPIPIGSERSYNFTRILCNKNQNRRFPMHVFYMTHYYSVSWKLIVFYKKNTYDNSRMIFHWKINIIDFSITPFLYHIILLCYVSWKLILSLVLFLHLIFFMEVLTLDIYHNISFIHLLYQFPSDTKMTIIN